MNTVEKRVRAALNKGELPTRVDVDALLRMLVGARAAAEAARAEGFAKAREMAAARCDVARSTWRDERLSTVAGHLAARIRAMQDDGACRGCGHRPHPSGSCGVSGVDGAGCQCTIRGDVP